MAADHFCLRWNNYQSNMVAELDTLRSEEHLVDVTLSCEGQKLRAHKIILSACSAYFRNVFKENPCDHPVVILKDVSHEDVEALLSFVYQGVVYVSEKKLASFLQTAELLQIKGLTGAASSIKENHAPSSAASDKGGPPPLAPTWPLGKHTKSCSSPTPPKRKKGTPVRIFKQQQHHHHNENSTGAGDGAGSDTNSNNDDRPDLDDQLSSDLVNESKLHSGGGGAGGGISVKQEAMDEGSDIVGGNNLHVSLGSMDDDTMPYHGSPTGAGSGNEEMMMMRDDGGDNSNSGGGYGDICDDDGGDNDVDADGDGDGDGEVKRVLDDDVAATLLERSLSGATVSRPFDLQGGPFSSFPIPAPGQGLPEQLTPADRLGRRPCPLCPKVISNKSNLLKHMRIRHSDEYNPAACMLCNKLFKNKYSLRAHFNIYHKSVVATATAANTNANVNASPNRNTNCTMPS